MLLIPIELYTNSRLNLATTWFWWISIVTWGSWWKKWSCTSVIHSHLQGFCRRKRTQTGQAPQSFTGRNNHQQVSRRLVALLVVEWGSPPLELLAPPSSASSCPCPSHPPASQQSTAWYSPLRSLMANIHTMPSLYTKIYIDFFCW